MVTIDVIGKYLHNKLAKQSGDVLVKWAMQYNQTF